MPKNANELEIHFINVSQGDSILIINRDVAAIGTAITKKRLTPPADSLDFLPFAIKKDVSLEGTVRYAAIIDGGEDPYGGDVYAYLKQQGVLDESKMGKGSKDYFSIIVSHFHSDHADGLRSIYKKKNSITNKIVDNYIPNRAYDMGDDEKLSPGTLTYRSYRKDISAFVGKTERINLEPQETIDLGADSNGDAITLRCFAANGVVYQGPTKEPKKIIDTKSKKIDQNDRSIILVLEYGDFRCLLGGDAGGKGNEEGGNDGDNKDQRTKQFWSTHGDLETPLRAGLLNHYTKDNKRPNTTPGHICCFKAHHHGSASSNDIYLLATMEPALVLCSSGTRTKFHGHPTAPTLHRIDPGNSSKWDWPSGDQIDSSVKAYYITEMAKVNKKYSWGGQKNQLFNPDYTKNGKIIGDIIVRPFNGVRTPNATNTIAIQVYGTGVQSQVNAGDKPLESAAPKNDASAIYPIGPFEHTCDKH